ncbi:MAG: formate/nitrite transporter FocA (FNT family) [Natronomonas sp.]|uniref:Formate/nitrite transporter FocA, FNT family n=1 Tax=Halorientalis regularis TaxID=660518 RepID=A0A1G7IYU0_9EURY|nr:formate/nitrite transporter family protein [Halorientalis regularis]SDF17793.1 Formate/nitrite transporter FocA, FNT family [Halorientalis regularis]
MNSQPNEAGATDDDSVAEADTESEHTPVSQENALRAQLQIGREELTRPKRGLALSGLSAGLDIGFGPLFMTALITTAAGVWSEPTIRLGTGLVYSLGFVFVVLSGTELFTEHTTLAVLPVLNGDATIFDLARLWGVVYCTNLLGGAVFAAGMVTFGPAYGLIAPTAFVRLAEPLVSHSVASTLFAAVLAGWLMGLLSWMVTSVKGSAARIILVVAITTIIGFGHLPHSIAGNVEVVAGLLASPSITIADYGRFLLVATTGNVVGGTIFVSLLKYGYVTGGIEE